MEKRLIFGLILFGLIFISLGGIVNSAQGEDTCDTYTNFFTCINNNCTWNPNSGTCWDGACGTFSESQIDCESYPICCYIPPSGSETIGRCVTTLFGECGKTFNCYYSEQDTDKDGYAAEGSKEIYSTTACEDAGYIDSSGDCNDNNLDIYPGNTENCSNGVDDDCNGEIDSSDIQCQNNPPSNGNINLYWATDYAGNNKITNDLTAEDGDKIYLILENSSESNLNFDIYDKEGFPISDKLINSDIGSSEIGNKMVANYTFDKQNIISITGEESLYNFYFKVKNSSGNYILSSKDNNYNYGVLNFKFNSLNGPSNPTNNGFCDSVIACSDLNETQCGICNVDSDSSGNCQAPSYSRCNWTGTECISQCVYVNESTGEEIGYCNYQTSISGDCSTDQLLNYVWTAEWINANPQSSFIEPSCIGGESQIACPAQTKLPLTSLFGIILTIIIIGFGYVIFNKN